MVICGERVTVWLGKASRAACGFCEFIFFGERGRIGAKLIETWKIDLGMAQVR
jgi:hypothetical protein